MNIELIDQNLFQIIHHTSCSGNWWDQFNLFVTSNSHHIWLFFVVLIAFTQKKAGWYPVLMCVAGFLVAWFLTDEYLKPLFERPRPFLELGTCVFGHKPSSFSFPSGHTITSSAVAALICLFHRSNKLVCVLAILFAIFCGYTRIYLGVHYPGDVLAGFVLGGLTGYLWFKATEWARVNYRAE